MVEPPARLTIPKRGRRRTAVAGTLGAVTAPERDDEVPTFIASVSEWSRDAVLSVVPLVIDGLRGCA
ncbi:hypothetical protein Shyhy01_68870 [Streptomyces hygroscopicus subsp. hygroscopicus]|nr:hypothetical protein Shyhy01_68870 [Streptomyces hygroscopicus subsp. hygroscopicus]